MFSAQASMYRFPKFGRSKQFMEMPWPRHEPDPVVRRRQRLAVFLGISILVHAWVLLIKLPEGSLNSSAIGQVVHREPLTVRLTRAAPRLPEAELAPAAPPPRPIPRPRTPPPRSAPVIVLPTPVPQAPVAAAPAPTPPPSPPADYARPMDMMAMVNMARARRQAADAAAARENAQAAVNDGEPTPAQTAETNLARNLLQLNQTPGIRHGTFGIISKGSRTAEVGLDIERPGTAKISHEVIEIDAGNLGDVDRAIVRGIIDAMRKRGLSDATWQSRRSGRVVSISLRPADQAELEAFLLKDIFEY
jgi:hypothetical protein